MRFASSLLGSRAIAGSFDFDALARTDDDGVTMGEAMRDFGLDADAIPSLARKPEDILAFVEVHIEQGPVLEAEGLPLGVVTGISGGDRLEVTITGMAIGRIRTTSVMSRASGVVIVSLPPWCTGLGDTSVIVGCVPLNRYGGLNTSTVSTPAWKCFPPVAMTSPVGHNTATEWYRRS